MFVVYKMLKKSDFEWQEIFDLLLNIWDYSEFLERHSDSNNFDIRQYRNGCIDIAKEK